MIEGLSKLVDFSVAADELWTFLNSNFSTAFFGAVFGSLTIIAIQWMGNHRKTLADINASIAVLSGALNTFLMIKRQHALPLARNYEENIKRLKVSSPSHHLPVQVYLRMFHCPEFHLDLPMDRIYGLADRHSGLIPLLMQSKRTVAEVENACEIWNELATRFKDLPDEERRYQYEGIRRKNGINDTFFEDTVRNLQVSVNDALFFTNLAINGLMKVGKKTLPFWLRKRIAKVEISDPEHKALMPADSYKQGWGLDGL